MTQDYISSYFGIEAGDPQASMDSVAKPSPKMKKDFLLRNQTEGFFLEQSY